MVDLIIRRATMADALQRGWVLDGYPQTFQQANLLTQRRIVPTATFVLKLNTYDLKQRIFLSNKKNN